MERAEARRLRSEEGLSARKIQQRLGVSKTLLQEAAQHFDDLY